jgi:hypothetical protein
VKTADLAVATDSICLTDAGSGSSGLGVRLDVDSGSADEHCGSTYVDCFIDHLPLSLKDDHRIKVANLVRANAALFSRSEEDIGRTRLISHTIDTGNHLPIKEALSRHPRAYLPLIDQFVDDLCDVISLNRHKRRLGDELGDRQALQRSATLLYRCAPGE